MTAATTTILDLGDKAITSWFDLIGVVITNFWPYILGIGALVALIYFLTRHGKLGSR
jgi:hypothetical protein